MREKFKFRLENLLIIRKKQEKKCADDYRELQDRLDHEQKQLEKMLQEKSNVATNERSIETESPSMEVWQYRISDAYSRHLDARISAQKLVIQRCISLADQSFLRLQEASRNRQTLEKLYERDKAGFKKSVKRKSQQRENEIALRMSIKADKH